VQNYHLQCVAAKFIKRQHLSRYHKKDIKALKLATHHHSITVFLPVMYRLYITVGKAEEAVSMYKQLKMYGDMVRLVKQYFPEHLDATHLQLAKVSDHAWKEHLYLSFYLVRLHLNLPQFIWTDLILFEPSGSECVVNRPAYWGCDQSDETKRPTLFWLVSAMSNWVSSFYSTLIATLFRWSEVSWDVVRWYEMR